MSDPGLKPSPFYTTKEAAAYLRVSEKTVLDLAKRGLLKSRKALRRHRFLKDDVHTFHDRTS
jgi:excisionase family DNA binding protein